MGSRTTCTSTIACSPPLSPPRRVVTFDFLGWGSSDKPAGYPYTTDVALKPGEVLSANDVMAYCRRSLANYKIPRRVEFLDTELPKSGSGKILKRILRERYWSHQERAVN